MRLTCYAATAVLIASSVLTSCYRLPEIQSGNLSIYAPDVLRLPKGIPVKTLDGIYTPTQNEIYHSDKRFRTLERKILFEPSK